MNKLSGFGLLFAVLLLASVSSLIVKNASAISFTNGPCPSGEARDYMGICFAIKECKASLFAAAGTCKVSEPQCTKVNGENRCTVTAPKYLGSPILISPQERHNNLPICEKLSQAGALMPKCRLAEKGEVGITKEDLLRSYDAHEAAKARNH
jgi:hypothetical protein